VSNERIVLGRKGEDISVEFLRKQGYKIIKRNYRCSLGEVDVIARDKQVICFVEVKTRRTDRYGLPEEAIDSYKQRRLARVALSYLKEKKLFNQDIRFDVVSICPDEIRIIKNAFVLNKHYFY